MHVVIHENEVNFSKRAFDCIFQQKSKCEYGVAVFDNNNINFEFFELFYKEKDLSEYFTDKSSRKKFADSLHQTIQ